MRLRKLFGADRIDKYYVLTLLALCLTLVAFLWIDPPDKLLGYFFYVFIALLVVVSASLGRAQQSRARRLLTLIKASADAIVEMDHRFVVTSWNVGAELVWGYTLSEAIGENIHALLKMEPTTIPDMEGTLSARHHWEGTIRAVAKDGTLMVCEARMVDLPGPRTHLKSSLLICRDMTERLDLEKRMIEQERMQAVGLLAGGIAHDFNNMLTVLLGNLDLADTDDGPLAHREYAARAGAAVAMASRLTAQLLEYARRGKSVVKPVNLSDLVSRILPLLRSASVARATVHTELDPDLPNVQVNESQIDQILMNLVINASEAIQAGKSGRIIVKTSARRIESELTVKNPPKFVKPGRYVCLSVKDNGTGMDESVRRRIFDPFFTTKVSGRGIGLASMLQIVYNYGGHIEVNSALGVGTEFHVFFPALETTEKLVSPERPTDPKLILIVDDEPGVRMVTTEILRRAGYQIETADNGVEGLNILERLRTTPILAVIDMLMPEMGGVDFARRAIQKNPQMRIVFMTGMTAEIPQDYLGQFLLLTKPFSPIQLLDVVARALE